MSNRLEITLDELRMAVDILPVAAAVTEGDGSILHINQSGIDILARTTGEDENIHVEKKNYGRYNISVFSDSEPCAQSITGKGS